MNNYTQHLTLGRKKSEYLNRHILVELDIYKPVHREILVSIYHIGRGFATRKALSSYFGINEEILNKTYLTPLYEMGLVYYAGQYSVNSLVGLTQFGESYCLRKRINSYNKIQPDDIPHIANKSNYLYQLASKFGIQTLDKFYDKNTHIYKHLNSIQGISCSLSSEDFFSKLEKSNIYLCSCTGNKIIFATLYKNKQSLLTRLNAIYNYMNTFTSVYNIVIELIVCSGGDKTASKSVKQINEFDLTEKERDSFLKNIKSGAMSDTISNTKMYVI